MSSQERIDAFFDAIESAGLSQAFEKISEMSKEYLDVNLEDIVEEFEQNENRPECRICYMKNEDNSEHFMYEIRNNENDEFGLDTDFTLINDMVHYEAVTKIRELLRLGYNVHF